MKFHRFIYRCDRARARGPAAAQQPIVIKFSHVVAVDTPKGKGAEYFKKLAEERTKGTVKVEVYPEQLSCSRMARRWRRCSSGRCRCSRPRCRSSARSARANSRCSTCPYMFDSYDELHKVTDGPVGKALFKKLESKGIIGLAYWDNGFKVHERQQARCACPRT